jgi:hypothetical protein
MHERLPLTVCEEQPFHKSKALDRALRSTNFFALLLVLVRDVVYYSNTTYRSASYREEPRSTIGIAAVQTAIEYEYRFTEYRFTEYEYDEIRCDARTTPIDRVRGAAFSQVKSSRSSTSVHEFLRSSSRTRPRFEPI